MSNAQWPRRLCHKSKLTTTELEEGKVEAEQTRTSKDFELVAKPDQFSSCFQFRDCMHKKE